MYYVMNWYLTHDNLNHAKVTKAKKRQRQRKDQSKAQEMIHQMIIATSHFKGQ